MTIKYCLFMEKSVTLKSKKGQTNVFEEAKCADYRGPKHQIVVERDPKYSEYMQMLFSKIEVFSFNTHKHLVYFCKGCYCFITLQGERRNDLGHPKSMLLSTKQLFKEEGITNIDSFIGWNKQTPYKIKYKGREEHKIITPVLNQYHRSSEYDGFRSNKEKREYVVELEKKVKRLEAENEILRKRLLISHLFEFAPSGVDPQTYLS